MTPCARPSVGVVRGMRSVYVRWGGRRPVRGVPAGALGRVLSLQENSSRPTKPDDSRQQNTAAAEGPWVVWGSRRNVCQSGTATMSSP